MALTQTQISQLYTAIFNRASEGEGNTYWRTMGTAASIADQMLATTDSKSYFGTSLDSNQAFIEQIYKNTLNKTIAQDASGIAYWVGLLNAKSRGEVVSSLVNAIDTYAPGGVNYKASDAVTVAAYNQFANRVAVSDYMASTVLKAPSDYKTSTSFSGDLIVTSDTATKTSAVSKISTTLVTSLLAPTALDLSSSDDTGISSSDNITKNISGLTITGNATSGSTVKLYDTNGTTLLGTTTTNSSGIFSVDVSLSAGKHSITAKATNTSGTTSAASSPLSITVDTTAPTAKLTSVTDNVGSVTGALTSGATTDDTSLAIAGTCESGATVNVYNGTTLLGAATASGTSWSYTATVANGLTYQLNVKETDLAGNVSAASSNFGVTCNTGTTSGGTSGIRLISTSSSGVSGNYSSYDSSISADGRYVAFESVASNLIDGSKTSGYRIYLKDTFTGATTLVSSNSSGVGQLGYNPDISADGRYVAFESDASNLVTGDTNGNEDIFLKDILSGVTTLVSSNSSSAQGNDSCYAPSISADGRYVAFESLATNLVNGDTNKSSDIFLKDTQTGTLTLISSSTSGEVGNGQSKNQDISSDGRYVVFQSDASNLVSGDTGSGTNIFLKDTQTGITTRISDSSGIQQDIRGYEPAISADGRYVTFYSGSGIFLKDTQTGILTLVSESGKYPDISADGRYVAFKSDSPYLVDGDINGANDIFLKDTLTGEIVLVSFNSVGVQGNDYSRAPSISADGRYVSYYSDVRAYGFGDTNSYADVFLVGVNDLF